MKRGTVIEDPCRINFRLGPNSETPPGGRHLEFQYGRHIAHIFDFNFETKADRNVIPVQSRFAETRFAETRFAETRFAKTRFAETRFAETPTLTLTLTPNPNPNP